MTSIFPQFNSSSSYYQEFEDPYYSNIQRIGEEEGTKLTSWNLNDGIPDEAFEEAERFAQVSPYIKKGMLESIENITLQIFAHLYSLADGADRTEIEAAVAPINYNQDSSPSPKSRYNHSTFHSFRDTNFYDDDYDYPIHTQNVVRNVLSAIADLFLGWKISNDQNEQTSLEEMSKILNKDLITWDKTLQKHYPFDFQFTMKLAFNQAEALLKSKQNDEQLAFVQRVTLYAMLIISLVGKLVNRKLVTVLGLIGSSITLFFMIKRYNGTNSFKTRQQEDNLKKSVDRIYHHAAIHRHNLQTSNLSDD